VTCDEIDAMEDGIEGDPVTLAFGRAENYQNNIQVVASTATKIEPGRDGEEIKGSRIHRWWLRSDQRKWFVPCPDCGAFHVLDDEPDWQNQRLHNLKWPVIEISAGVWEHKLEEAYYECPACHSHWDDAKRVQAIMRGEWRATAKFNGIRGYWLSGFNTLFPAKKGYKNKLHQMAAEFYDACLNGEGAQIALLNTFFCKPKEIRAERLEVSPLLERREKYTPETLPNEIAVVTCSVDVQGNRLELETIGLGDSDESWGIEWFKLIGDPEKDEVWEQLKTFLKKNIPRRWHRTPHFLHRNRPRPLAGTRPQVHQTLRHPPRAWRLRRAQSPGEPHHRQAQQNLQLLFLFRSHESGQGNDFQTAEARKTGSRLSALPVELRKRLFRRPHRRRMQSEILSRSP
jgi:phage terminase large subunit GpA-like protein